MIDKFESIIRGRELFENTNTDSKFYHASQQPIKSINDIDFNKSKEIGLHVGTYQQALNRSGTYNESYLCEIDFDYRNAFDIKEDLGDFNDVQVAINLDKLPGLKGIHKKAIEVFRNAEDNEPKSGRNVLSDFYRMVFLYKGIKCLKYNNKVEGDKDSDSNITYIILSKDIINNIKYIGKIDKKGNIIKEIIK